MKTPDSLRFYSAPFFVPLGTPFVLTAIKTSDDQLRCSEFYLFLFHLPKGQVFKRGRYFYCSLPTAIISNEALHDDAFRMAQAELNALVFDARRTKGHHVIPYDFRFELTPCSPDSLLLAFIRNKPFDELRTLRDKTRSQDLRQFLPTVEVLEGWKIEPGEDFDAPPKQAEANLNSKNWPVHSPPPTTVAG